MDELIQRIRSIAPERAGLLFEQLRGLSDSSGVDAEIPRLPGELPSPLSMGQERLWLFEQMYPNTGVYNIPAIIPVQAGYVPELEESLRLLLNRHEILRTRYPITQGEVRQQVTSLGDVELPTTDFRDRRENNRMDAAHELATQEASGSFDLLNGPVFRARLLHLDERLDWLLITVHHIATDGWSQEILIRELRAIFAAKVSRQEITLPPLPIRYADYAAYQRAAADGNTAREAGDYWRRQLANCPPVCTLPADRPRPAEQTFNGATQTFRLSSQTSSRLRDMARANGQTTFTVLYAALVTMIARHTGRNDIVVGTPVAGRNHRQTESLVGFFVNTLVLRMRLKADSTFQEILQLAKTTVVDAMSHQDCPLEQVVRDLGVRRHPGRNPLFQVMFAVQNDGESQSSEEASGPRLPDLQHPEYEQGYAKFDITFGFAEDSSGIGGMIEYNTDLYDHQSVARIVHRFNTLLDALAVDQSTQINKLPLLLGHERNLLCKGCNEIPDDVWDCVRDVASRQNWQRTEMGVAVVDRFGQPPPFGVEGELCVDGSTNLADSLRLGEPIPSGAIKVGWRARYTDQGSLELTAGADRIVLWRGLSLDLNQIAAGLEEAGVAEATVLPIPDSTEHAVAVFCFLNEEDPFTASSLDFEIRKRFPDVCDAIRVVPVVSEADLPRSELSLRELDLIQQTPPPADEANADPITAAIIGIWRDVLKVAEVGPDENFFDLGGDSLAAVRVLGRVKSALNVDLELLTLFEGGVSVIAESVRKSMAESGQDNTQLSETNDMTDEGSQSFTVDTDASTASAVADSIDTMSDAEVEEQLTRLLTAQPNDEPHDNSRLVEPAIASDSADLDQLTDNEVDAMLAKLMAAGTAEQDPLETHAANNDSTAKRNEV